MKTQEKWGLGILVGSLLTWAFWKKASANSEVRLSEKDSGSTVVVKPGMSLIITLPSNPSTGYGWYAATDLFPLGRPEVYASGATGVPGSPVLETRTYRITTAMAGPHRIYLEYKRAWEQNTEPAGAFFVDVEVHT
jgi:inhibitor of cysteine peptidase